MPVSLSKAHRKLLENTTAAARVLAESACRAALENLAVHEKEYRGHMTVEQRQLRNRLRARGKALGHPRDPRTGTQDIHHLTELAAYEQWHRLLFTRFLTENHLLITDEAHDSQQITVEECEELAPELKARDGFDLACRFASLTLPGVFRRDDPVLDLPIALNDQVELRKLLAALPSECFRADDALGWTYQFWQAQRKDEINDSGKKIGADELAPVTQLFTEDYMVEFLLHNTLGAWWAGRIGAITADTEQEARSQAALSARDGVPAISWTYLRFVQDGTTKTWLPAAGVFDRWPKSASLIRLLDPCMGSGHFLVFALPLLVRLRMEEEELSSQDAVVAVLRDNINGLELDERCTQIAAFNVALTAWRLAGYQKLPTLNIACSGLAPSATEAEWLALAGKDDRLQRGMMRLHSLFKDAPVLGSLIDPRAQGGNLIEAEFHELAPLLTAALAADEKRNTKLEDDTAELAVIAQGLAKAAELLAEQFTLVTTNVPYLGRGKQGEILKEYCGRVHPQAKADLATCFIERCFALCDASGSAAFVSPQNWWFLGTYAKFRDRLLRQQSLQVVVTLGEEAWQSFGDRGPIATMLILYLAVPTAEHMFAAIDALPWGSIKDKIVEIGSGDVRFLVQFDQHGSADHRITVDSPPSGTLLLRYATCNQGIGTADANRYIQKFWEVHASETWEFYQMAPVANISVSGCHSVIRWEKGRGPLSQSPQARICGQPVWEKRGVAVAVTRDLYRSLYLGRMFDCTLGALVSLHSDYERAVIAFVLSDSFTKFVREIDKSLSVTESSLLKVSFDLEYWNKVAAELYPDGLPKPYSSDPTQWLFSGHPERSDQPLHVAIARLLGYRWPRQTGSSFPDCLALSSDGLERFADEGGIVCLPPVNREQPAAGRLRQLLTAALGAFDERSLITSAGLKGSKCKTLEDWLRDEFFEQHAKLFQDRPFIWHLWDGRADGFHALVNYHRLNHANLQKLTYSYLGDWIQQQAEDTKADKPGAAERLGAARSLQNKLAGILEGEAPLDIFVRWKPIKEQAQGWHPDLNDGIRQNIRPFLLAGDVGKRGAGLFRTVPLSLKDKDRGTEPERSKTDYPWFWCEEEPGTNPKGERDFIGNRWNDVHLSLEAKQKARA
jgi:hypothetical protein